MRNQASKNFSISGPSKCIMMIKVYIILLMFSKRLQSFIEQDKLRLNKHEQITCEKNIKNCFKIDPGMIHKQI